jgi:hypothetical protein
MFLLILFLASCSDDNCDCLNGNGVVVTENRVSGNFNTLNIKGDVDVILVPSDSTFLKVETGINLMDNIKTYITDSILYIKNETSCNWLRSFDNKVKIFVAIKNLSHITFRSNGKLSCADTLRMPVLKINVWDGSGSIALKMNNYANYVAMHIGAVDITLSGKSSQLYLYNACYGPFFGSSLETNYGYLTNRGFNDCYVNCSGELDVRVENVGNVYYSGNPQPVKYVRTGKGKLVKQ